MAKLSLVKLSLAKQNDRNGAHVFAALRRARLVLICERYGPFVFLFCMIGLFYAGLAWLGVFALAPLIVKILALIGFLLAFLAVCAKAWRADFPTAHEAVARLEASSGVSHRPLTALLDVQAGERGDMQSPEGILWRTHQARVQALLSRLRAGWPRPQIEKHDPFAVRSLVILLAFIGFVVAGADRTTRLFDVFTFSGLQPAIVARLDAWVKPPAYTGKPPVFLTRETIPDPRDAAIIVPEGSVATIRVVNAGQAVVSFIPEEGDATLIAATQPQPAHDQAAGEAGHPQPADYDFTLSESGTLSFAKSGEERKWRFDVVADNAPTISFLTDPEVQRSGAIQILAAMQDDYGVVQADALIEPIEGEGAPIKRARPLYDTPDFPLTLQRGRVREGSSKTLRSIVEHPWAGARVMMTLRAYDEAGGEGRSEPVAFSLPIRRFTDPLALALVEQRRLLAMDAGYASQLVDVLDVLTIRPEQFDDKVAALIALAAVRRGLLDARDDEALRRVVDALWDIASGLEDGDLSEAERALRDALQALREAIENDASEEEIAQLMEQARQAMRDFMQALAEQAEQSGERAQNDQPAIDPSQILNPQDLQKMLDQIEDLAKTGSRDAAQQLLSELQQMMENLQANRQEDGQQGEDQARQMLNELGEMIRRQQQLMDQTFRAPRQGPGQQQQSPQSPGQQGERQGQNPGQQQGDQSGQGGEGAPSGSGTGQGQAQQGPLHEEQGALAQRLQKFIDQLGQGASDPSGQLDEAQRSMQGAAGQLQEGDLEGAGDQQADALNQLRNGAQALAEQMSGQGEGQGEHGLAQGDRRADPLGRREGRSGNDFGDNVEVPDAIDTQRAREILDAIRKRLGETVRPQLELDYLERLLRP